MRKRTILQALAIALLVLFVNGPNVVSLIIVLVGELLLAVFAYKQKEKKDEKVQEPLAPAHELLQLYGDPDDIILLDAVRAEVPKYILYKTLPYARIELAKLGPDAGIIGAAMLQ